MLTNYREGSPPCAGIALWSAFLLMLLTIALGGCGSESSAADDAQHEQARILRDRLHAQVTDWLDHDALARKKDGYVYAIDVTQLAIYAAERGDADLYNRLRRIIVEHLIAKRNGHTFVAWRYRENQPLDASGTTEALRAPARSGSAHNGSTDPLTARWRSRSAVATPVMPAPTRTSG